MLLNEIQNLCYCTTFSEMNSCTFGHSSIYTIFYFDRPAEILFVFTMCILACRQDSDVVFTLDKSGSIGKENFRRQLDFLRGVVMDMNLNNMHRVGFETYSDSAMVHFNLNSFQNPVDIINQLNVYYSAGTTNTGEAIRMARTNMFTTQNGRR